MIIKEYKFKKNTKTKRKKKNTKETAKGGKK